jgi:hypothetical protein
MGDNARNGTAFRCDASSPIDQCSDIAPRTSRTLIMLNLAPSSVLSQLFPTAMALPAL